MSKMSHGPRSGSRMKMTKSIKERRFPKVNDMVRTFEVGDYAAVHINPSVHDGMPFHNFQGKTGVIVEKQGECYILAISVGSVKKKLVAAPVHLKKIDVGKN